MLNQQKPMPRDQREDGIIGVHSIFATIQGEGPFAGHYAIFIRLHGCNLQCPWCDTEYTNKLDECLPIHITEEVQRMSPGHQPLIVITGGEPFRQNITPLVLMLLRLRYRVQIETNGVLCPNEFFPWDDAFLTVVCSPKTGKIHPTVAQKTHAFKYVLSHDSIGRDGLPEMALAHTLGGNVGVARPPVGWAGPVYLNPMDAKDDITNRANMKAVVTSVMSNPQYIMGVQMHKLSGLP